MKTLLALAAFAALVPVVRAQEKTQDLKAEVPFYGNEKCCYMKGKKAKMSNFVETPNGKVYICCNDCNAEAQKDGEKAYAKAYPKPKVHALTKCPVSGKDLGKDAVAMKWQGHEFKVCTKECVDTFKKNPDAYIAMMENPKLKDLGNETCPVSGEPANGAVAIVGTDIVRLRSRKDGDEFKKDVAKFLAKAKEQGKGDKPAPKDEQPKKE